MFNEEDGRKKEKCVCCSVKTAQTRQLFNLIFLWTDGMLYCFISLAFSRYLL